jgi:RimJ/RimL family protein N-acetyltransferase
MMSTNLSYLHAQNHNYDLRRAGDRARRAREARAAQVDILRVDGGRVFQLRRFGVGDRDGLARLFTRLGSESRYRRFLSPKPELTARELTYLTDIDHVDHEAVAAIDCSDGSLAGVARYIRDPKRPCAAEVSLEVADELQRLGIGTALATRLVARAQASDLAVLTASALRENRAARAIMQRFGFRPKPSRGPVIDLELTLAERGGAEERPGCAA